MMRAISSADFVSNPCEASLGLSVIRSWRLVTGEEWGVCPLVRCVSAGGAGVMVAIGVVYLDNSPSPIVALTKENRSQIFIGSNLICRCLFRYGKPLSQANENCVMKGRSNLLNRFIRAVGPRAIRKQNHRKPTFTINPERRPGVAQMPDGRSAQMFS